MDAMGYKPKMWGKSSSLNHWLYDCSDIYQILISCGVATPTTSDSWYLWPTTFTLPCTSTNPAVSRVLVWIPTRPTTATGMLPGAANLRESWWVELDGHALQGSNRPYGEKLENRLKTTGRSRGYGIGSQEGTHFRDEVWFVDRKCKYFCKNH